MRKKFHYFNPTDQSKKTYFSKIYSKYEISTIIQYTTLLVGITGYVDLKNYPTTIIEMHGLAPSILLGSFLLTLIIIYLYRIHIFEWRKIYAINMYDFLLQVIGLSSIFYMLLILIFDMLNPYKIVITSILLILTIMITQHRRSKYLEALEKSDLYESNIVDLKDLFENHVSVSDSMILLEERDVDYDLLDRNSIINHLVNTILSTKPQGKFVISLEGKWGSGKTTILNNAKRIIEEKDPNIVIVDDFDPWLYGSEESIIDNFFSCLIKRNYLKMNTGEIKRNINILTNAITKSPQDLNLLYTLLVPNTDLLSSKKLINEYLKQCGKRIVIYIDNLDRVDDDKVIFIFKLIGTVLDFDRITYVISFDNVKVRNIFNLNLNIDYEYIKKIIQLQINVPEISSDTIQTIVKVSTSNLIDLYEKVGNEKAEYEKFISYISTHIHDIRDFKRFVNSIAVRVLVEKSNLYKRDKMIIEFIKMKHYDLYKSIYLDRKFFISEDLSYNQNLYIETYSREKFNNDGKIFFEELFTKFPDTRDLLGILFPYVERYSKNQDLKPEYYFVDTTIYKNIARNRGIASAKYFDLYFSETENQFSILGGLIDNFIQSINKERVTVSSNFVGMLNSVPLYTHKEMLEIIQQNIDDIADESVLEFLSTLLRYIFRIDDSSVFFGLSGRERCYYLMWELIQRLSDYEFENFMNQADGQYSQLLTVNTISFWFSKDKESKNVEGREGKWKALESKMVKEITDFDIDLYSDEYYHHRSIWALYRNLSLDTNLFKSYILNHVRRNTIFRMLYDALSHSISNTHRYYFESSKLNAMFDEDYLKKYMASITAESEDEKIILELYTLYLDNPHSSFGDDISIEFSNEKKFIL